MKLLVPPICLFFPTLLAAAQPVQFLADIKPILTQHCCGCHGAQKQRGGLRLDSVAAIHEGGNSGPVVVPGDGSASKLIQAVSITEGPRAMPPQGPRLTRPRIELLKAWIDQGAAGPVEEEASANPAVQARAHWAFQAPVRPELPRVRNAAWARNPIDCFILAQLEKQGLNPSPEANRAVLIRRLYLDLLGLLPPVEEVDAFQSDRRADAYERLVDRLLQSPHFGERWARLWLDQARYADSEGYVDEARTIWKYRDWVIDAFNRGLPFDQFIMEQLAGDLLPNASLHQQIATGFHRNTLFNSEPGIDVEEFRVEAVADRVNTTATVFLGLTLACARCHDHKFDPLSQREYYQLFAFFNNADDETLELPSSEQACQKRHIRLAIADLEDSVRCFDTSSPDRLAAWEKCLSNDDRARLRYPARDALLIPALQRSAEQQEQIRTVHRDLEKVRHIVGGFNDHFTAAAQLHCLLVRTAVEQQVAELRTHEPPIVTTLVLRQRDTPRLTHVLLSGDLHQPGVAVDPGTPAILPPLTGAHLTRLDLARWLAAPQNPLTARVAVNRFWQHFFGLGLVETENDFGTQSTPPSHPELLDWLATEFTQQGWNVKAMLRLMVTAAAYRQESQVRPELSAVDPRNRLLARQSRLRLDAETVRDAALSASGLLCPTVGGPSVFPPQPPGASGSKPWNVSNGPDRYRRGLYTHFWRSAPDPTLTVFDAPDANSTCTRRNRSNTPLQALTLLNDPTFFEFAQGLAARLVKLGQLDEAARLQRAFRICLARAPTPEEQAALTRLLRQQFVEGTGRLEPELLVPGAPGSELDKGRLAAWTVLARVLMNLDEFITRE